MNILGSLTNISLGEYIHHTVLNPNRSTTGIPGINLEKEIGEGRGLPEGEEGGVVIL